MNLGKPTGHAICLDFLVSEKEHLLAWNKRKNFVRLHSFMFVNYFERMGWKDYRSKEFYF